MTPRQLAEALTRALDFEVLLAPDSLDTCVALCRSQSRRVLLSIGHEPVREATLAAAVQRTPTTVLCGRLDELEAHGEAMARSVGAGRLVRAWEWALEPEVTLFGRRGAMGSDEQPPSRTLAESPVPPSPLVLESLRHAIDSFDPRRYPPVHPQALVEALAAHHGVSASNIVVSGSGSVELLQRVFRACTDPGDEVQAFVPTFDRVPSLCAQEGLVLRLSRERVVTPSARLVYAVTPNGPDARIATQAELESLRSALPPDRVLIVDRAYADLDEPDPLVFQAPGPVVILRTMSKAGALAGLRIGWAIAPEPIARLLRRFGAPHGVSELAAQAAIALLADVEHRKASRSKVDAARTQLALSLERLGFDVLGGHGHLLCVRAPESLRALLDEDQTLPFQPVAGHDGAFTVAVTDEVLPALLARRLDRMKTKEPRT